MYNRLVRISIGADHAGYELKESIKRALNARGVTVDDVGTYSGDSVDYPDYAAQVAGRVVSGESDRGILVCGTGIGMAMAANKVQGVRAAPAHDEISARMAREHNDANILALGARLTPTDVALELVRIFLDTPFEGGRHQRRVDKIAALEGRKG